jgi:hypothetical protein
MSPAGRESAIQSISLNLNRCSRGGCIIGFQRCGPSRLHVDVLPVSCFFLIQHLLNEELNSSMEVLFHIAILHNWSQRCGVDRRKVLMKHLLPGHSVLALEHIFKLHKGV